MTDIKDKVQLNKVTHAVRASQAVLQYGVGAMVDFPEQTLMTAAPELWEGSVVEIHDERLEKVLHVDYFGMPGSKDDGRYQSGVAYSRFPEWYFCPRCRKFQPLKDWINEYKSNPKCKKWLDNDPYMVRRLRCPSCFQDLVVARIIVACGHGHIDDFPWVKWVHARNSFGPRPVCGNSKLRFTTSASSSEGLEGLTITCDTCHCKSTLRGAFDKDAFKNLDERTGYAYGFQCTGRHPWKNFKEPCGEYPHVLQRGGSSVYFPVSVSSLVIPPYSSKLTSSIQGSSFFSDLKKAITEGIKTLSTLPIQVTQEMKDAVIAQKISEFATKIANDIGKSETQVMPVLQRRWTGAADATYTTTSVKYRAEEYEALSGEVTMEDKNGEFVRESTDISEYNIPFVKSISLIHKVREVQALIGFSRLEPVGGENSTPEGAIKCISVKENDTNWYPGYDVRGEGIFIEFDSAAIDSWRTGNEKVQKRVNLLNENYANSYYGQKRPREITSKFLLLHTLAHLLMKQLSFECGYSIASIKERIFCSEPSEGKEMSGIFLYTASGDSEGTMGGLVRQGRSDAFPVLFKKALESAISCSNDPVCSLSMGQGRDSLNLSACHSCALVPETSCEEFNIFLDRGVVIGTFEDRSIGFYSEYVFGSEWNSSRKITSKKQGSTKKIILIEGGNNLSGASWADICNNALQFSENQHEKAIFKGIKERHTEFDVLSKPYQSGTFQVVGCPNFYDVDYIWPEKKVMLFCSGNKEEYKAALDSDWKCIDISDESVTVEFILERIKGEK